MSFFDWVVEHWIFSSLVVYVLLTIRLVFGLWKRFVEESSWYQRFVLRLTRGRRTRQIKGRDLIILIPLFLLGLLFLFPTTPILWPVLKYREIRKEKRIAMECRQRLERQNEVERQQRQENRSRAEARKKWFATNKPTLYYNTINGITAVLRPADYERMKRETKHARLDERWNHTILKPSTHIFTFVTKSGGELIEARGSHIRHGRVAGWISRLHQLCEEHDCSLVKDETIFVPWVNETLVSFSEQERVFTRGGSDWLAAELIDQQAPPELRPLS